MDSEADMEDNVSEDEDLQQMELAEMIVGVIILMLNVLQIKIRVFMDWSINQEDIQMLKMTTLLMKTQNNAKIKMKK